MTPEHVELLLDSAEVAIRACLAGGNLAGSSHAGPDPERLPERLRRPCSAFVTLHVDGRLNGCIGAIDSPEPVGVCVPRLAIQAAFDDPRLPALRRQDLAGLHIEISLLSPRSTVPAGSRAELLGQLRAGVDGLIISSGDRRAVFLPTVWTQLPDPDDFLDQLLIKAGLPIDRWPTDLRAEVFTTESFGRHAR